ncbi:MAG: hypothetical protein ACREUO_05695 [Burkholderiales bacterium]
MCFEYEWEYHLRRAEEARKAMQKAEEALKKPKPAAPAAAPEADVKEHEPVPA